MALTCSLTALKNFWHEPAQAYGICVSQDFDQSALHECSKLFPACVQYLKQVQFAGKTGTCVTIPATHDQQLRLLIIAGLGKHITVESYRRALAQVIRAAQKNRVQTLAIQIPSTEFKETPEEYLVKQSAIIANMTDYAFDTFKEIPGGHQDLTILFATDKPHESLTQELHTGTIIGQAVNDARQWVNLPANILRPEELAAQAREIARQHQLECRVFSEQEINTLGMGGLAAVSKGSEQDCCLITLEYKTTTKNAPTIGLVGKGITFDSGGLSLKPAQNMETMKEDMAGAAVIIATMKALAQLQAPINVIGIAPVAENLPSGLAAKPGDIIRMYNDKTVEIKNTDAEGRLILADALAYLVKNYQPTAIIDVATLTGACSHALGPFFSGLFSEHDDLVKRIIHAAEQSGEPVWRLPLTDDYKKAVEGTVSDLCNTAKPRFFAGATTAAAFLQNFVGNVAWAHIDIAGTAFDVPDIPYHRSNTATGIGVRLLIELACNWQHAK